MNVYDHFTSQLGAAPSDPTLRDLSTTSPCGETCVAVIDKAKELLALCDASAHHLIVDGVDDCCQTFWRG